MQDKLWEFVTNQHLVEAVERGVHIIDAHRLCTRMHYKTLIRLCYSHETSHVEDREYSSLTANGARRSTRFQDLGLNYASVSGLCRAYVTRRALLKR